METFWAIVITLAILYGIFWLISIYIGWTVVGFMVATLISMTLFFIKDGKAKKAHLLDTISSSYVLALWGATMILYWVDVLNPVHSFITFLLTGCVTFLPFILSWVFFSGKPKFRFLFFTAFAVAGLFGIVWLPVLNNDYYRWLEIELPLEATIEKIPASDISSTFVSMSIPTLIVEQRKRTPNEEVRYSALNEQFDPAFISTNASDAVKTIIFLSFEYDTYSSYNYTSRNVGSSSISSRGTVHSYQHVCRIYFYSPEKNVKSLYATIKGPAPEKPTDSSDSWGDRIPNKEVVEKLDFLFRKR